jgi:hypothetical protein
MDIVKKNLISILCGVVALIAIIGLFWPTGSYQEQLQTELNQRKQTQASLQQLLHQSRKLPIVQPGQSEQAPLEQFPSEAIIKQGEAAQQEVKTEAAQMLKTAVEINRHPLLVEASLPSPRTTDQFRFSGEYVRRLNVPLNNAKDIAPPNYPQSVQQQILNGGQPPTKEQVDAAAKELWEKKYVPQQATYSNGQTNEAELKAQADQETAKLPEQMKQQVATTHKMYVDPGALDYSPALQTAAQTGRPPAPADIWFAQVGLWVEEDVAKAIAASNASAKNVLDATVKRLIKIELPRVDKDSRDFYVLAAAPGGGAAGAGAAMPAPADPAAPVASVSPTGRVSNPLYDVVAFTVVMDVDAAKVPDVLQELTRNQFLYVRQTDVSNVDSIAEQAMGYLYGKSPVAQLTLKCEAIFLRDWTKDLMPSVVQQQLGITPATGQPTAYAQ